MKTRLILVLPLALLLAALVGVPEPAPISAADPAATATTPSPAPAASAPAEAVPQGRLTPPERPIRALQALNLDCGSEAELDARFQTWKEAGVQAIIVRVFHNPGDGFYPFITPTAEAGVYFQTRHTPMVGDALTPLLGAAHRNHLLLIAWMTTRYADYGGGSAAGHGCLKWEPGTGLTPSRGWSVLLPDVQDRLALIYTDLARYPIDGVLIQDDLMLHHTEDLNPRVREMYRAETGRSAEPADLFFKEGRGRVGYRDGFLAWRRWENRKLLALAERLRAAVQAVRPRTPVGLNLYYENVTDPANSLVWFGQDIDSTLQSHLDFYALML